MDFSVSETCSALMRAFAGECQAHTRYLLAARTAVRQELHVLRQVFELTAKQELIHAELFAGKLQQNGVTVIRPAEEYPLDPAQDLRCILEAAVQHELHEADTVYPEFAARAAAEGCVQEAELFRGIAEIERSHAKRFQMFAGLMQQNALFRSEEQTVWLCLNCGHLHFGTEPPQNCPVCNAVQGFSVRQQTAPFTLTEGETLR